ncbi:hypothetical protein PG996_002682 [Apiospora saccharicola]|uniref:Fungal STAND N-terminal Goodbye domain-containing protein n=1 Tax=Apiospora saccharicola TaxID=335842 RepID=A0ABR1WN69_9PEZI
MASTTALSINESTPQLMVSGSEAPPRLEVTRPGNSPASQVKEFTQIMTEFKEKHPNEPTARIEKGYSIRSKTGWEEVLKVLEDAAKEYDGTKGLKGAFKKTKGFIESKADTVQRVSSVVPDVDYAKPILGTLNFLLETFKQTCKVREDVEGGIEKLKKNFGLVEDYIAMYSGKRKVVEAVVTLYVTILKAIEEVIGYYTQHIAIKGFKAIWDGKNYQKSLLECLENISRDGNELIHEADTAHKQVTNKVAEDVGSIDRRTENIEVLFKDFNSGIRIMVKDHLLAMEARHERDKRFLQCQIERQDAENMELKKLIYRTITPEPIPVAAPAIVTQQDLLEFLDSANIETTDIEYILSQRQLIISGCQDRTEQIMKSPQLKKWMVQAESKELLVHGNSEPEPISPISFFCALLMRNLRDVDQFKSLAFFCGIHSYEEFGGARPMIMSLLAQLLEQQHFDLGFVDHELAYSMDSGNIETFCYVFRQLVRQVRSTESVFCVIDGINFYEGMGEESLQETAYVLRSLLDLTRERGNVFKILVTSPSITEDTRQAIEDEDYLALPEQTTNTLGFSDLRFERQWQEGLAAEYD